VFSYLRLQTHGREDYDPICPKGVEESLLDASFLCLAKEMVKMAVEILDVCIEFFEVSSHMLQISMHVLQFRFHVRHKFFRHLFTVSFSIA